MVAAVVAAMFTVVVAAIVPGFIAVALQLQLWFLLPLKQLWLLQWSM